MISIKHFVTSYELSEQLDSFELPVVVYDGSFFYDKLDKSLFVVVDCGNNELTGVPVESDKVYIKKFIAKEFLKAYTSAELGELLPIDYTLPVKLDEGWAFVGADGNIYTDFYYANETEARMMYLLYFLKHKVLTVQDLIGKEDESK